MHLEKNAFYPEPYFDREELESEYTEILKNGFEPDELIINPDLPVSGLNLAAAWPFPNCLKEPYENLFRELKKLGPDIYVYPYSQTHITLITLVNFKKNGCGNAEQKKLIPDIIAAADRELRDCKPFELDFGRPVLFKKAAIIPIINKTRKTFFLREKLSPVLKKLNLEIEIPRRIHSTICRFLNQPNDTVKFINDFELIAKSCCLGKAAINELLLTSETKPYMRRGSILHSFYLK